MVSMHQIISDLKSWAPKIQRNAKSVLYEQAKTLLFDVKSHSPVDTGQYREAWRLNRPRFGSFNIIANVSLRNDDYKSNLMEFGASPNAAPWYFPEGQKRTKTGKLKLKDGRVWAGGLNPGHNKTEGGAFYQLFLKNDNRVMKLANVVANSVISAIR